MITRATAFTLFASALLAAEPEKLTKLRSSYDAAASKALTPIQKTYLTELEKLKTDFTKAGKLEDALAIDAEIKRFQTPSAVPQTDGGDAGIKSGSAKKVFRELVGTQWHSEDWKRDGTFMNDGTFHFTDPKIAPILWKITENSQLLLSGGSAGDLRDASLSPKLDSFVFPFGPPKVFKRIASPRP